MGWKYLSKYLKLYYSTELSHLSRKKIFLAIRLLMLCYLFIPILKVMLNTSMLKLSIYVCINLIYFKVLDFWLNIFHYNFEYFLGVIKNFKSCLFLLLIIAIIVKLKLFQEIYKKLTFIRKIILIYFKVLMRLT